MPSNDVCWFASTIARKEGTQQRDEPGMKPFERTWLA
jgi:hypothetical protein